MLDMQLKAQVGTHASWGRAIIRVFPNRLNEEVSKLQADVLPHNKRKQCVKRHIVFSLRGCSMVFVGKNRSLTSSFLYKYN